MDRKHHKAMLLERNRKFQRLNQHAEQHQAETDAIRAAEAELRAAPPVETAGDEPIWSERMKTVKLRTGSRRTRSRGMWDRFVGASGGGMAR